MTSTSTPTASATERLAARRKGQAAVETMMLTFMCAMVLVAMYQLFQITWGAQNAQIRAREAILHDLTYMSGAGTSFTSPGNTVWDGNNYKKAEHGTPLNFSASASDQVGDHSIQVTVRITD